jgi:uncharacterized protein (UPF0332 family)
MPYERLLKTGRIQPYSAQLVEISQLLQIASRDIATAKRNLDEAPDWAYTIAYNAALQASRALMLHDGFRPRGGEQHASVIEFIEERLGINHKKQVQLFDQMRRKRHRVVYDTPGLISKSEAEQAIQFSQDFIEALTEQITGQNRLPI